MVIGNLPRGGGVFLINFAPDKVSDTLRKKKEEMEWLGSRMRWVEVERVMPSAISPYCLFHDQCNDAFISNAHDEMQYRNAIRDAFISNAHDEI